MAAPKRELVLKKETELRCEVSENSTLTLKLINGNAEVFGVEMAANREYSFRDQNIAVFTWYGCTIELTGGENGVYVADSTPMVAYINTHIQLEARRDFALKNQDRGPRVLVVGPHDHGKSSLCQILTAYALRLDRNPIFVDLDVGLSSISLPGSISAVPLEKVNLSVEEGLTNYNPLVYFYGHSTPKENVELYKHYVATLAGQVERRLAKDDDANASGVIINSFGWVDGSGLDVIAHIIRSFAVDVVLVMNHDKLYSTLMTSADGSGQPRPVIVKLPSSGGIVTRDAAVRKRLRKARIREYFYGRQVVGNAMVFSPERKEGLPLVAFNFLRAGGIQLSEGMRTIEKVAKQDDCKLMRITPTADLVYSVVALLHDPDPDQVGEEDVKGDVPQSLLHSNAAGFISILQLDLDSGRMTVLSPCQGALPTQNLLLGSVKWLES